MCRGIKSSEEAEQCRLAAAGGSDDCDKLTLLNGERHVTQDGEFLAATHVFFGYFASNQHESGVSGPQSSITENPARGRDRRARNNRRVRFWFGRQRSKWK